MVGVGIDVGAISAKAVVYDGQLKGYSIKPTGWTPREAGHQVFQEALIQAGYGEEDVGYIVGTGYGRVSLSFIHKSVTEITCHAKGIYYLFKNIPLIIDIGGQDSKVIVLDTTGRVINFSMNDKCAAGSGRFLEVMAMALGMTINELGSFGNAAEPVAISSMCTVFAESEVISLLAKGASKDSIVSGINCHAYEHYVENEGLRHNCYLHRWGGKEFWGQTCIGKGTRHQINSSRGTTDLRSTGCSDYRF